MNARPSYAVEAMSRPDDFGLVLVDNASTDHTHSILQGVAAGALTIGL